jgi:hypothetical protein
VFDPQKPQICESWLTMIREHNFLSFFFCLRESVFVVCCLRSDFQLLHGPPHRKVSADFLLLESLGEPEFRNVDEEQCIVCIASPVILDSRGFLH